MSKRSRFSAEDVRNMESLHAQGWSYAKIGREFGAYHSTIIFLIDPLYREKKKEKMRHYQEHFKQKVKPLTISGERTYGRTDYKQYVKDFDAKIVKEWW